MKLATLDAARALGIDDEVGSLEPGKKADIIAVDISHSHQIPTQYPYSTLVHTANQENVLFTMVDGEVLYDQGDWTTLDSERILGACPRDAREAARLMIERGTVVRSTQGRADIMIIAHREVRRVRDLHRGSWRKSHARRGGRSARRTCRRCRRDRDPDRARHAAQLLVFVFPVVALVLGYLAGYLLSSLVDMDPDTLGAALCDRPPR